MLGEMLENVRKTCPLVHNITNYVTVNDCANVLLVCGGSPIMADDEDKAAEITSIFGGLNINLGTLSSAIAANLAKGETLEQAAKDAKDYISGALAAGFDLGKGVGPMDHAFMVNGTCKEEHRLLTCHLPGNSL